MLAPGEDREGVMVALETLRKRLGTDVATEVLNSHALRPSLVERTPPWTPMAVLETRQSDLEQVVTLFLERETGAGLENTPPLEEYDFDDEFVGLPSEPSPEGLLDRR